MKYTFYEAATPCGGLLNQGEIYFAEGDGKIPTLAGERVSAAMLVWKKQIQAIPIFDGILKESWENYPNKTTFRMQISDGLDSWETQVTIIEAREIKNGKALECLAKIPNEEEVVQISIAHLRVM